MAEKDSDIIGISRLSDRQAGAEGGQGSAAEGATPPVTPTEIRIAEIWQSALPGILIYKDANFIAIGGDSLSLAQVIMEIEKLYSVTLSVEVIANNLTLSGMASVVDQLTASK
jgi:acyl carrier protein